MLLIRGNKISDSYSIDLSLKNPFYIYNLWKKNIKNIGGFLPLRII